MYSIETENLKKTFVEGKERIEALRGVDLHIEKNQVFGLLGPNGAGKTTTIHVLSTLIFPTSGKAKVLGYDITKEKEKIRKKIGVCFSGTRFSFDKKPPEILEYYGRLFGIEKQERKKRIKKLIEDLDITPFQNKVFGYLSTGMRQKIAVAKSLINEPEVLFLDEPTAGLDVEVAIIVRKYILKELKEREMTVLLTSHHLNEVEEMCKNMAIINQGKIVTVGDIKSIRKKLEFPDIIHLYLSDYKNLGFLKKVEGVIDYNINDGLFIKTKDGLSVLKKIETLLNKSGIKIKDVEIRKASLEEMFLKIIGADIKPDRKEEVEEEHYD